MIRNPGRVICIILLCLWVALPASGQKLESEKFFQGQGATLYYEVRGAKTGTPLLVINGGPGVDHTYMHSTLHPSSALDELAKDCPVIFYDQRGVGKSPALQAGQSCTVADQVADTLWKDMEDLDFTPELPKFRFPTLVMTGRFDMNVAPSVAYKIHKAISGSRFVVFEQSGHMPFFEEQESFVQTVKRFLFGK